MIWALWRFNAARQHVEKEQRWSSWHSSKGEGWRVFRHRIFFFFFFFFFFSCIWYIPDDLGSTTRKPVIQKFFRGWRTFCSSKRPAFQHQTKLIALQKAFYSIFCQAAFAEAAIIKEECVSLTIAYAWVKHIAPLWGISLRFLRQETRNYFSYCPEKWSLAMS